MVEDVKGAKMSTDNSDLLLPERLLKATEVAEILNVSRAMVYQLMQQRKIRTVRIEGARRVRLADLKLYIEQNLTPAA
jgi:excisionase family DNA binding protein